MKIKFSKAPIIFLMGPTASGKTALAIELLARHTQLQGSLLNYEIISVDSAMVYQQMDIGSAKPSPQELAQAPHRLIDFMDPKQSYSASQFCSDAIEHINDIHCRGNVPLLVGGTMLYFKALKDGLADLPKTDAKVRAGVKKQLDDKGIVALHQELSGFDPVTAKRLHPNDSQRITRAIEVYQMCGKSLSQLHAEQQTRRLSNPILSIALAPKDRSQLHQRILQRFNQMMQQGFLQEVEALYQRTDLDLDCASMRSVGYRQLWQHLDGEMSLDEALERAIIATRQLAKRQYTWLRSWPHIQWFDPLVAEEQQACVESIKCFIQDHKKAITI